jgi:hypothetical protein
MLYSQRIPARIQWFVSFGEGITLLLLAAMTAKFVIAAKERKVAKAIIKQQGETIKQMQEASQQQEEKTVNG